MAGEGNSSTDLSLQLAILIKNDFNSQPQNPKLSDSLQINLKLNIQNYALWTRMIRVAIGGKSKSLLAHLTSNPPEQSDEKYEKWEQDDLIVFSWLIQNIEPILASNLTEFPTAKTLWDALVVTYSSGRDKLQTYNLHVKANEMKQNDISLENMWIALQGIWGEIERIDPNPMKCPEDIKVYTKIRSEQKLFQFLNALNRKYDPIKREILRLDPLFTAEEAYAAVRKEESHQNILGITSKEVETGIRVGLIAAESINPNGSGFATKGARRPQPPKEDKTNLKCTHCGLMKHTKDQCFKLVGYPEWWCDGHKKNKTKAATAVGNDTTNINNNNGAVFGGGMAAAISKDEEKPTTGKGFGDFFSPDPSFTNSTYVTGKVNTAQIYHDNQDKSWIFDCGATDTMTFDHSDIISTAKPIRSHIQTANGGIMDVKYG